MDFDEEMSSLQIEDLGEYFFPSELSNDNWKGFSLGYGEDDTVVQSTTTTASSSTSTSMASSVSKPIAIARPSGHSHLGHLRDRSGSLSNSLGGGGISLGSMMPDPSLLVSPPMLAPSFSEMLKHTNGSLAAAALGFGQLPNGNSDFPMSPATTMQGSTMAMTAMTAMTAATASTASTLTNESTAVPTGSSPPRSKDEQLMDLANFTIEGRFHRTGKPQAFLAQRPPPAARPAPVKVAADGSNAAAVCKRIMDDDDDDEDDDDDDDYSAKRRSSGASTPSTVFGSKRSFDMVDACSTASCSTLAAPEDDRGFRKKSREKMRRQEVNVKFDELIDLLGLSNRVRKSAILQEAVSAIKSLKRERDEMRRDRDRLQQEVSKLATCLQYSHLGSVAAANAVAMSQAAQSNPHFQTMNTQQQSQHAQLTSMNPHQMPGPGCFPIGGAAFGAALTPNGGVGSSAAISSSMNATPIAPKVLKSASDLKT